MTLSINGKTYEAGELIAYVKKLEKENLVLHEMNKKRLDLQKENAELKEKVNILDNCDRLGDVIIEAYKEQLTKAKEIMNIAIEGIKHWGIVGGTERPFEKQAEKLFNLFLDKAEQFLSEVEK